MKSCNKGPSPTGNPSLSVFTFYGLSLPDSTPISHTCFYIAMALTPSPLIASWVVQTEAEPCDITVQGVHSKALSIFLLCHHCQWLVLSEKVIGTVGCSPMQRHAVSKVLEHFYSPLLPADNVTQ